MAQQPRARILVTGGTGYIGSHTVVELVNSGFAVTVVDNFSNSSREALARVRRLVSQPDWIDFEELDLLDAAAITAVLTARRYSAVIHFAALKAVGESVAKPLLYYDNNIRGLLNLLHAMNAGGCKNIVFSSSATVYGSGLPPFTEASPTGVGITNPYGMTKHMAEIILTDLQKGQADMGVVLLRYFNPVGAHVSGTIGEDPAGIPSNLMPFIQRVAAGRLPQLTVYGDDWDTPDGTALRDYIHVVDLAKGHLAACDWLFRRAADVVAAAAGGASAPASAAAAPVGGAALCEVFNLGTGRPSSVKEVIAAYEVAAGGRPLPHTFGPRRPGDVQGSWADASKAASVLGWTAGKTLPDMCADSWRWASANPQGYGGSK